jgi:hypothetical protein
MEHLAFFRCTIQVFGTFQGPGHIFYACVCALIACLKIISVSKYLNYHHEFEIIKFSREYACVPDTISTGVVCVSFILSIMIG